MLRPARLLWSARLLWRIERLTERLTRDGLHGNVDLGHFRPVLLGPVVVDQLVGLLQHHVLAVQLLHLGALVVPFSGCSLHHHRVHSNGPIVITILLRWAQLIQLRRADP